MPAVNCKFYHQGRCLHSDVHEAFDWKGSPILCILELPADPRLPKDSKACQLQKPAQKER